VAIEINNSEYGEIGFHSDRYIAARRPQGEFSPMQQQYLFDTYLKRNAFPINGRKIISGDQKWLYCPNRYSFEMDIYYVGEDPANEIQLEQYTEFKHVAEFQGRSFLLEDYDYDHGRTLLMDFDKGELVPRDSDLFKSVYSAAQKQRKAYSLKLDDVSIEIDGDGRIISESTPSGFRFLRSNYPILTFSLESASYIFDQETGDVLDPLDPYYTANYHYFKTKLGIQAADGTAIQGRSLGKLGKATETYLDHLVKVEGTDLILAIGVYYIKVLDARNLNDLVPIPPKNLNYLALFSHYPRQSRQFFIQEEGKSFIDEKVNIPYRKRTIWKLDFTMEAQIRAFCQNLSKWRYPNLNKDTVNEACLMPPVRL